MHRKNGKDLEKLVLRMFKSAGHRGAHLTPETRDGGIDIYSNAPDGHDLFIPTVTQCKYYSCESVIEDEVRSFAGAMLGIIGDFPYCQGYFVTTSYFTNDAWEFASDFNECNRNRAHLWLIDKDQLNRDLKALHFDEWIA